MGLGICIWMIDALHGRILRFYDSFGKTGRNLQNKFHLEQFLCLFGTLWLSILMFSWFDRVRRFRLGIAINKYFECSAPPLAEEASLIEEETFEV